MSPDASAPGTLGKRPGPSIPPPGRPPAPWTSGRDPPFMSLPFREAGRVGPMAWSALAPKVEEAHRAGNFTVAFRQAPLYKPDPFRITQMQPGIGYFIGEAQLVRLPFNTRLIGGTYSSVLAWVELQANPLPTRKELGTPDQPVLWDVVAQVGTVQSYDDSHNHADVHFVSKILPTDPGFAWIPAAILSDLT